MFPTPRSTSLPTVAPPLPTDGLNVLHPIARKDSRSIAPMTPPMSPTDPDSRMDDMSVDHPVPHSKDSDVDHLSIQDSEIDSEPLPAHLPSRTLDESRDCLPGSLRLTDFEVRGTLGMYHSFHFVPPSPARCVVSFEPDHFDCHPGAGTFGRVLLVRLRSPSHQTRSANCFALKVLRKSEIVRLRQVEHVNAERYIMSRVRHPFIVDLYATFQDRLNIYMLLSYVPGGELFTHLRRAQRFTPDVTRFYLATIVLALKYLHSFNIIYRDLKPENLLLDSRGYLRLTDFGFAKIVEDRTWTLCGTPEYLAPEIILNEGHGKPADWWACGVLAYEMMVGFPPFFDETAPGIYEKILRGRIYWPKEMDRLSKELVKAFLHPDRTKRLGNLIGGSQDVLDHPWFRGVDWDALERKEIRVRSPLLPSMDRVVLTCVIGTGTYRPSRIIIGRHPSLFPSSPSSCGGHSGADEERSSSNPRLTQPCLRGILRVPPFSHSRPRASLSTTATPILPSLSRHLAVFLILLLVLLLPLIPRAIRLIIFTPREFCWDGSIVRPLSY